MPEESNKKILLLVDDDPLLIRMYQRKLAMDGYKVNFALNGEEGLASAAKEKPDIVLLDIMMPKMNGIETLSELKKRPEMREVPVIVLTNMGAKPEDVKRAMDLGAMDYLVKSDTSLKALSERVKNALDGK